MWASTQFKFLLQCKENILHQDNNTKQKAIRFTGMVQNGYDPLVCIIS